MKTLPLLLLGAGAVYFIAKKPAKVSTTSTKEDSIASGQIGSKDVGYKIVNSKLTIYDKQKAWDYAFKVGADGAEVNNVDDNTWSPSPLREKLFGGYLETELSVKTLMKTKEQALFLFDLMRFLYSGIASKLIDFEKDEDNGLPTLKGFRSNIAKITGFDVSDFKVELIKK